jgi:hypothetical protein
MKPEEMPIIQQAVARGLGEGDIKKIELLGVPVAELKARFAQLLKPPTKKTKLSKPKSKIRVKK